MKNLNADTHYDSGLHPTSGFEDNKFIIKSQGEECFNKISMEKSRVFITAKGHQMRCGDVSPDGLKLLRRRLKPAISWKLDSRVRVWGIIINISKYIAAYSNVK